MEFVKESKRAFRRIFDNPKSLIGISLLSTVSLITLVAGAYLIYLENFTAGITLYIIGLLFSFYIGGYSLENMHNLQKGKGLPKVTKNGKNKFIWGIAILVIAIAYSLIAVIPTAIIDVLWGRKIGTIVEYILTFIIIFPTMAAMIEYSKKMKFSDAFNKEIFKKAYRFNFVVYLIAAFLISVILSIALWATVIGGIVLGNLGNLYYQHMAVKAYTEKKSKRRKVKAKKKRKRK